MKRNYLTVSAVPDKESQDVIRTLKEKILQEIGIEEIADSGQEYRIVLGSYWRFKKKNLIRRISSAVTSVHAFSAVTKEAATGADFEIRLMLEDTAELEQLHSAFDGKYVDKTPWKPYITIYKGKKEILCKDGNTASKRFEPVSIVIDALELDGFLPFQAIKKIALLPKIQDRSMNTDQEDDLSRVFLKDLQPSQFYISEEKLRKTESWFDPEDLSRFDPISVKKLDGKLVMLDGHTRAVAALNAGLKKVPLVWETEEWDWEMYRRCVHECIQRDIHSPEDLVPRVISAGEYWEKWEAWCDRMQAEVEASRKQ